MPQTSLSCEHVISSLDVHGSFLGKGLTYKLWYSHDQSQGVLSFDCMFLQIIITCYFISSVINFYITCHRRWSTIRGPSPYIMWSVCRVFLEKEEHKDYLAITTLFLSTQTDDTIRSPRKISQNCYQFFLFPKMG